MSLSFFLSLYEYERKTMIIEGTARVQQVADLNFIRELSSWGDFALFACD